MATQNLRVGNGKALPAVSPRPSWVKFTYKAATNNAGIADVLEVIDVPAKTFVHLVQWEVTTVEGAAATFDIGDGTTPAGYVSNANANALGSGVSGPVAGYVNTSDAGVAQDAIVLNPAYSGGKYYATADSIDIIADAALVKAVIEIRALMSHFVD